MQVGIKKENGFKAGCSMQGLPVGIQETARPPFHIASLLSLPPSPGAAEGAAGSAAAHASYNLPVPPSVPVPEADCSTLGGAAEWSLTSLSTGKPFHPLRFFKAKQSIIAANCLRIATVKFGGIFLILQVHSSPSTRCSNRLH